MLSKHIIHTYIPLPSLRRLLGVVNFVSFDSELLGLVIFLKKV